MTTEHLRLVLDTAQDAQLLFKLGETIVQSRDPNNCSELSAGRLTAMKPSGGVRGIVAGDIIAAIGGSHHGTTTE